MLLIFAPFVVLEYFIVKFNLLFMLFQFILIFSLSYLFYQFGMWGGADAKALIVLSVIYPVYPEIFFTPIINKGFGILAFSTLSNSIIFSPAVILFVFIKNLKKGLKGGNLLYYFTGYRVDADRIPRFHNLLEYINSGKLVRVKRGVEPDEKMLRELKKARENGKVDKIWVTPGLPFLVFITAGFIISLLLGDVLFWIIGLILF
jgi:preflagellin peptidase FlaK